MAYPAKLQFTAAPYGPAAALVRWLFALPQLAIAPALREVGQVVAVVSRFVNVSTGPFRRSGRIFGAWRSGPTASRSSYAPWSREQNRPLSPP